MIQLKVIIAVAQSDFLRKKLELLWILIRIKIREKEKTHKKIKRKGYEKVTKIETGLK